MRVLWCPIFSMRSYETGKYSILKDGNFQLTMARVLASDFDQIAITVPRESSDFEEMLERYKDLTHVSFIETWYGANALETRETFWKVNGDWIQSQFGLNRYWDLLITDITGYPGLGNVVYNFNITKLPELDRPYIDKFFETDLKSIERSLFTTVLNPRQREYILEIRPDLLGKVLVNTKCAHATLLPEHHVWMADPKEIFWPFRLSDKAYKWTELLEEFQAQRLHEQGFTITITDPNDTSGEDLPKFIRKIRPTKSEYYRILAQQPIVVMLDDIDTVLHPGTIEFFHYGCPVITFQSKLIENPNAIFHLEQIGSALRDPVYNRIDTSPFVYSVGEIDLFYNKVFANVTSN